MNDTPQRILDVWPSLTEGQREALIEIAEAAAPQAPQLQLIDREATALERSRDDFATGRTLSYDEARSETKEFLRGLVDKA